MYCPVFHGSYFVLVTAMCAVCKMMCDGYLLLFNWLFISFVIVGDESERWHDFLKSEIRQLECPLKDFINLCVDHVLTISFFLP